MNFLKITGKQSKKRKNRLWILLLATYILTGFLFPMNVSAVASQKVRVGYYKRDGFQEGMSETTRKSGYAYEYLQRISDYTGWEYEYVYGDLSELKEKFQNNEIDILAGFSSNDKIPSNMEFADEPMGTETCYIYKKIGNSSIKSGYLAGLIQKKVGVLKNTKEEKYLKAYQKEKGVSFHIIRYDDMTTMKQKLDEGKIDCMAAEDMEVSEYKDLISCITVKQDDYYLGVASTKRTFLREVNDADSKLREDNPYFLQKLYTKYYQNTLINTVQTDNEASWLLTHDTLKIGFLEEHMPFCEVDKHGKVTGVLNDVIASMKKEPELKGLSIQAIRYSSVEKLYKALQNKEIQAVFPAFDDGWYAGQNDTRVSTQMVSTAMNVVFSGNYTEDTYKTLAVTKNSMFQLGYVQKYYPDSKLIYVDSLEECIDAVKDGRASATILSRYRTTEYLSKTANRKLNFLGLQQSCELGFAVRSEDIELLSLLNRSIRIIGTDAIDSYANKYSFYEKKYSVRDFITDHLFGTAIFILVFVGGLITIFAFYVRNNIKSRKQMEIAQKEIQGAKDRMEEALQKAEYANDAKSRFLFNMSHDIRTPMNAIIGYAELLNKFDDVPERAGRYIENIKKSGEALLELTNEILEMARIESGTVEVKEEPGNLTEMYDILQIIFSGECHRKQQKLDFDIALPRSQVYYDQRKVKGIFLNIISNAVKYTPDGGTITVCARECESGEEGLITIQSVVEDNGTGISKEFLPKIFDSFSRERTVTENKVVGSGLGMGIVKKYIDMLHGEIHIKSEPGKGTEVTVTLTFRAVEGTPVPAKESVSMALDARRMRILLAEDNELNREIATEILKGEGFNVDSVEDGVACVAAVRDAAPGTYDLILMDVQMPNMDGIQATREIRQLSDPEKADVKVIAVTANVLELDRKQAVEAGMNGFSGKPIEIPKLLEEICRVMNEE